MSLADHGLPCGVAIMQRAGGSASYPKGHVVELVRSGLVPACSFPEAVDMQGDKDETDDVQVIVWRRPVP